MDHIMKRDLYQNKLLIALESIIMLFTDAILDYIVRPLIMVLKIKLCF